ncbi:MAG TPA: NAD-dependent epimerase/dehydratase family protein [Thermoanaerobaculia bacterium]|nr:NAD-dependent epimerase/dehydratase family protein [Thermoanaerobaculia bacterium]
MKIVVTGALGHIGSRLIRELPGHELVLLDDLSTQRFVSLFNLPEHSRYRFHEIDVRAAELEPFFTDADAVIHLAALTDAATSFDRAEQVEEVNFGATVRVAEACAKAGAPLVFLSTTSVYGTQNEVVDEDCAESELQPQSPYAVSKLRAERALAQIEGLRFVACRFGTIFGVSPGMRFHTAVNKFIWQACQGIPITVWRSALDQRRPYLDLSDAVRALALILDRRLFDNRVYNVLTINATVREIVDAIREHVPDLQVELVESRIMNQLSYTVSDARFRSLGFDVRGDLKRGVAETVALLRGLQGLH